MPLGLTFGSPWFLWGLLALPALAGVFAWGERQAGVRMARLIQAPRLRTQLTGAASATRRRGRYALFLLALGFLVVALAEPRGGYETIPTHRRGLDLIVVVDVSKSMLATDLPPNRLARAKLAVQDFVTQLEGDRVGLVAFAGTAFLQAPLTVDYDAVLNADNELDTEIIPRGGTNLGAAINLAVDAFGKAEAGNRAILLLSDGEPTTDGEEAAGLQAAQHAAETGVKIFTLGFGTPEGSLIPLHSDGEFVRDADGKIVRTKLDENTLKGIAKAGNGFYVRFNGDAAIRTVVQQGLSQLKAGEIDTRQSRRPIERYQWPLGIGLALLTAGAFLSERRKAKAPLSPGSEAMPTRKRAVGTAALLLAAIGLLPATIRAEAPPAPSGDDALRLYNEKHYDDAYKAFQSLAEKHPDQGSLQFNAGASAYMGKQYDEALDAFGKAMTSDNVDLQAKANYNFGNTLFRRGADQKDRDQKIADWKNALQHYDTTLDALKQRGPDGSNSPLSKDTAFNRELVKKQLDEALKESPPPPPNKFSQQDQKQNDKQDKNNQPGKSGQQSKEDPQGKDGQQNKPSPGPGDQQQGQDKSSENQPPKPDQSQQGQGKDQPGKNQPDSQPPDQSGQPSPQNSDGKSSGGGKQDGSQPPSPSPGSADKPEGSQGGPKSDASGTPGKDRPNPDANKPREHGDFLAKPSEAGDNSKGQPEDKSEDKPAEAGKMNASQARALLNSLKDEDVHVDLGGDSKRQHSDDDPPLKDW